jgi:hypothetical protein
MEHDNPIVHQIDNIRFFLEKNSRKVNWDLESIDLKTAYKGILIRFVKVKIVRKNTGLYTIGLN